MRDYLSPGFFDALDSPTLKESKETPVRKSTENKDDDAYVLTYDNTKKGSWLDGLFGGGCACGTWKKVYRY